MSFRPDVKPVLWGPPDALQYAMWVNAEKWGIDPANIILALPMLEGGGDFTLDYAKGAKFTIQVPMGGSAQWVNGRIRTTGTGTSAYYIYGPTPDIQATCSSVFAGQKLSAETPATYGKYWITVDAELQLARSASSTIMQFSGGTNRTIWSTTPSGVLGGDPWAMVVQYSGSGTTVNKYIGYHNGTWSAESTATNTLPSTFSSTFSIGNRSSDALRNIEQDFDYFYLINQYLTLDQARLFYYEPYSLFMPVSRPVYFFTSTSSVNLTSPANNATDVVQPITFSWGSVVGAYDYNLQVSTSSDFTTTEVDITTTSTSHEVSGLTASTEHHWRVRYR